MYDNLSKKNYVVYTSWTCCCIWRCKIARVPSEENYHVRRTLAYSIWNEAHRPTHVHINLNILVIIVSWEFINGIQNECCCVYLFVLSLYLPWQNCTRVTWRKLWRLPKSGLYKLDRCTWLVQSQTTRRHEVTDARITHELPIAISLDSWQRDSKPFSANNPHTCRTLKRVC